MNLSPRREYLLKDEQEFIDQIRRLTEENRDLKKLERGHSKCETKQQEIYDMLNRYKGQLEISEKKCSAFENDNKIFAKMLEKEKQYNNASKLNHEQEMKMLKNKHETELRKYASQLDRMTKEKQNMLEEGKMKNQSKEISTFQNMEKDVSFLLMEKEIAVNKLQNADDTIQKLHRNLEKKEHRIRSLTEHLLRSEENVSKLSDELKDARNDRKEVVEESLQRLQIQNENKKLVLVQTTKRAEDLSKQSLQRYKDEAERITNNLSKDLIEHVKKNESLDKQVKQLSERNATIFRDKESAVIQINKLTSILHDKEKEIQSLIGERSRLVETSEETEKKLRKDVSSYRSAYDKMARENGDLSEQCLTLQKEKASLLKDKEDTQKQITGLTRTSQSMERKIESLTNELISYRNSNEDLLLVHDKEKRRFEKEKKKAAIEINDLKRALHDKEREIGSLNDELKRFKEHVTMLSNEVQLIQKSKEQAVSDSEKRFHTENASLKSDYEKAILKINELSRECTNLHKDKKCTAVLVDELSKTVEDREAQIHSLKAELSQLVETSEETEKKLRKDVSSYRSAYDKMARENGDLSEQCLTLQKEKASLLKDKEDTQKQIKGLKRTSQSMKRKIESLTNELISYRNSNEDLLLVHDKEKGRFEKEKKKTDIEINDLKRALHDKEREIGSLNDELKRFKEHVTMLSNEVQLIQKSKEQAVSDSEKRFHTENASLKSDYEKAILKINKLSRVCTNLHEDKKCTAVLVDELSKTVEDREAQIHSLKAELSHHIMKVAFDRVAPRRKHRLFVAAIDFGTTYSGYAFSSKDEWKNNPLKIHTNVWNSGTKTSAKTPTALLLSPKREFLSFGYDAETKYSESEGNFASYYYFHCFKLKLQGNDNLNLDTLIGDATGKNLDAITVFSTSIKYITDHLFESLSDNFPEIERDDIHFVLTVPAIWNDIAKRFMAEAAVRAGISSEQLSIAMEQETAAIYCREDYLSQDQDRASNLKEGMNFMVVDLGGGTTDITFHRSLDNGKFAEIGPTTGGLWGGQNVNEAFFNFIAELFGQSVIDQLQKMQMDDYLELERRFEIKKRSIASNKTGSVKINFPLIVFQLANEMNKTESVCDIIAKNAKYAGKIKVEAQKLQIPTEILVSLFRPTIGKIIEHIQTILKENTNEVDVILMVGGFAECDIVQSEFKKNFSDKKIIVPEEAGLAVMKGAVLYGHMQ
ncbi:uncharacterized protein LOC111126599 isoform X2 [Crassostrea virginica]